MDVSTALSQKKCEKLSNDVPLIKWPGGKRLLLKYIFPLIPGTFGSYYEPFIGGGALFFALQPLSSVLADSNEELINCYMQIRDHPEEIIVLLSHLKNTKEMYYSIRESEPEDNISKAVRFIYLRKLAFNGIYRVNEQGRFNVPYSYNEKAVICISEKIRAASILLSSVELSCGDFEKTVGEAKERDFIYFDPPYTVAHGNNGFRKYNASIFSWDDQKRLASIAVNLAERGCKVVISNADHSSIRSLYSYFNLAVVTRSSTISASSSHRRHITECLFYN